ncbi:Hint domain-containing protein [Myxococcus sp. K15C18031901]|uniref:Hint domain-containing protein n=1 Tax=Myxococcus dinghuensis TaxID=2906761 RepID=UPI0020A7BDEE|nr:Hint domain-containing protein [Myxococcus dinghuensis]MCP3105025.1 Hint domain-containing protein [Myxococcus dinghuensis]
MHKAGTKLSRMLPLAGVMLLTAGWSNPLTPPKEDRANAQSLVERFDAAVKDTGVFRVDLDLANDGDWQFLVGRLTSAGKSERNAPELFRRLDFMRERALARQAAGTQPANLVEGAWCNHFLKYSQDPVNSNGFTTFFPVVEVACKDGADYVYADLFNYDTNVAETNSVLVSSASGEEYGGGLAFDDVRAPATVASGKGRVLRMESLLMALGADLDQTSYIVERGASVSTPPTVAFTHPRKVLVNAPNAEIYACQLRGGADCDYSVAGYQNGSLVPYPSVPAGVAATYPTLAGTLNPADYWTFGAPYDYENLYVPVRGTVNAGAEGGFQCTLNSVSRARIQLITNVSGRTCLNQTEFVTSLPLGSNVTPLNVLTNMNRLFNTAGTGTSPSDCKASTVVNEMTRYTITITGKVRCNGVELPLLVIYPKANSGVTPNIYFRNSCMASGTQVKLADGRVVPVEEVQMGDKVLANAQGTALTVTDISRGNEVKPMLRLRDAAGHDATLTEMHPVIMATGEVVAAKDLRVQDQVRTEQGVSTLTSITKVSPEGQRVYNLALGTDQELLAVKKNGRTLYAGGFLVGDLRMQDALTLPKREQISILQRLPKAWHQDFRNGIKPAVAH